MTLDQLPKLSTALALVDTVQAARGGKRYAKPLLMASLMPGKDRATQRALALGGAGDIALLGSSDGAFMAGLGSFLVSHGAWIVALRQREGGGFLRRNPTAAIPYAAAFVGFNGFLWNRTGKDRVPVLVYSSALMAMALTALDSGKWRTALGGALFVASDTLLSLERFAHVKLPAHEGLVMLTYTKAQALLATA